MRHRHFAFFLDQAYGNIIPSLGISMRLLERGHLVTYVVGESFAPLVQSIGATALVVDLLKTREQAVSELMIENDHQKYRFDTEYLQQRLKQLVEQQTQHTLAQLSALEAERRPDMIIYDDSMNESGRALASRLGIPKVRLATQFIEPVHLDLFSSDELIVVTVPEFFQPPLDPLKSGLRFKFIGFIEEGRCLPFHPWTPLSGTNSRVLVSPTTGQLPQIEFCKAIVSIFRDQPWDVILSISGSHDAISRFDPRTLGELPPNIQINRHSGNFEILRSVDLYIGQAGQGGALEAIYWGRPQILVPPTPYHHLVAKRVADLGLGVCLPFAELSRDTLLGHANELLENKTTRARIEAAQRSMRERSGAEWGATILEERLGSMAL